MNGMVLLLLFIAGKVFSSESFKVVGDHTDVPIIEHLGDFIPQNLKFTNEKDQLVSLTCLIDKPTVLSLVYFDCPGLCSPLLDGVSQAIEKSNLELGKDYQVITVSFNYRDTQEKAKQKKETFLRRHSKSHSAYWIYLTGDSTNIYNLCNAVGFKFKRQGLNFIHPAAIMIHSPKGKLTRYLYGISFIPFDFKMSIMEAERGVSLPTLNRALEYGFTNHHTVMPYTLRITKLVGTLLLFTLLLSVIVLILKGRKKKVELA
jgi:protein SCO1/2